MPSQPLHKTQGLHAATRKPGQRWPLWWRTQYSRWWAGGLQNMSLTSEGRRGPTLPHLRQSGLEAVSLHTPQLLVLALRHIGRIGAPLHSGFGIEKLVLLFFLLRITICKLPSGAVPLVPATHLQKVLLVFPVAFSRAVGRLCHHKSR